MKDKRLTFLSNRGVGLNSDLKLVQSYLTKNYSTVDMDYRFFLKNGRSKNPMARQGYARAKKEFCVNMQKVICADASLNFSMEEVEEGDVRLLLATPYDYLYKNAIPIANGKSDNKKKRTFRNFTHIVAGSPFMARLLKEAYDMENIQLIEDFCLPFSWEINQPEEQDKVRKNLQFYFPEMKGKKVLSIMAYGKEPIRKNFLKHFDLKDFIKKLGKDWFVLTNMEDVMEKAYILDTKYQSSFGYVNRIMPGQDVLFVSDVLITNNGRMAGYFATRGKKVYCPQYAKNSFEKYMENRFPDMYLTSGKDFSHIAATQDVASVQQKEFNKLFSYDTLKNPYESIRKLLITE